MRSHRTHSAGPPTTSNDERALSGSESPSAARERRPRRHKPEHTEPREPVWQRVDVSGDEVWFSMGAGGPPELPPAKPIWGGDDDGDHCSIATIEGLLKKMPGARPFEGSPHEQVLRVLTLIHEASPRQGGQLSTFARTLNEQHAHPWSCASSHQRLKVATRTLYAWLDNSAHMPPQEASNIRSALRQLSETLQASEANLSLLERAHRFFWKGGWPEDDLKLALVTTTTKQLTLATEVDTKLFGDQSAFVDAIVRWCSARAGTRAALALRQSLVPAQINFEVPDFPYPIRTKNTEATLAMASLAAASLASELPKSPVCIGLDGADAKIYALVIYPTTAAALAQVYSTQSLGLPVVVDDSIVRETELLRQGSLEHTLSQSRIIDCHEGTRGPAGNHAAGNDWLRLRLDSGVTSRCGLPICLSVWARETGNGAPTRIVVGGGVSTNFAEDDTPAALVVANRDNDLTAQERNAVMRLIRTHFQQGETGVDPIA